MSSMLYFKLRWKKTIFSRKDIDEMPISEFIFKLHIHYVPTGKRNDLARMIHEGRDENRLVAAASEM